MKNYPQLFYKLLKSEEHIIDGFKYELISVEKDKEFLETIEFVFNVVLPDPKQSYVYSKFKMDIENIIDRLFVIVGDSFHVRYKFLVDMKEPREVYIRPSTVVKIIELAQNQFNRVNFILKDKRKLELEISLRPSKKKFYGADEDTIDFAFDLIVDEMKVDEKKYNPKQEDIDSLKAWLHDSISDSDTFRSKMEDDIYGILNPEMQINSYEIFIACFYNIKSICGFESSTLRSGRDWKFPTEIS